MGNKTMIDKIKRGSFGEDERTIKDAHNALAGSTPKTVSMLLAT